MIPHNRPTIGSKEILAISKVVNSKKISQGREVEEFQKEFARYLHLPEKNVVAVNNGTSALYLALRVLNAKNKKVIYPSYSCSSLRNATSLINGIEDLRDIEEGTPNMRSYNYDKNSIVIIPHIYGFPSDIKKQNSVNFIEDSCQALGAKYNGKPILMGDISIFSFYATKMMTTAGQGGMLASKNTALIREVKDYLAFDLRKDSKIRFNFQMTDIQAAMGRIQLKRIDEFVQKRDEIFKFYSDLRIPLLDVKYSKKTFKPVRFRTVMMNKNPKRLIDKFKKLGIETINPLETWELLSKNKKLKNSIQLTKNTISLPCYPSLKKKDLIKIEQAIDKLQLYI